jgi:hypothetical protein
MKLSTEEIDLLYLGLYGEYRSLLAASGSPILSKEQATFLIDRIRPIADLLLKLREEQRRRGGATR